MVYTLLTDSSHTHVSLAEGHEVRRRELAAGVRTVLVYLGEVEDEDETTLVLQLALFLVVLVLFEH